MDEITRFYTEQQREAAMKARAEAPAPTPEEQYLDAMGILNPPLDPAGQDEQVMALSDGVPILPENASAEPAVPVVGDTPEPPKPSRPWRGAAPAPTGESAAPPAPGNPV